MLIDRVQFTAASQADRSRGLLGWVACTIDGRYRLDGLALRRTSEGRLALKFPVRRDAAGRDHTIFRPTCDQVRRDVESAVFSALGIEDGVSPW